jgi:hypothetical protein
MEEQSVLINLDTPFMAQQAVRDILRLSSIEEPVPKVILEGLLEVTKLVVTNKLSSLERLAGLLIGYQAPLLGSKDLGKVYSIEWGQLPTIEEVLEVEEETGEDMPESDNSLSSKFLDQLATRLEEAMIANTPPIALEGRKLIVRVRVNVGSIMFELRNDISIVECGCLDELGNLYRKKLISEDGVWRAKCTKRLC